MMQVFDACFMFLPENVVHDDGSMLDSWHRESWRVTYGQCYVRLHGNSTMCNINIFFTCLIRYSKA